MWSAIRNSCVGNLPDLLELLSMSQLEELFIALVQVRHAFLEPVEFKSIGDACIVI